MNQATPINQLPNSGQNQADNQVVSEILNEIGEEQNIDNAPQMQPVPTGTIQENIPMNYQMDNQVQQVPMQNQTDFGQFLAQKGYTSSPIYERILSEVKNPAIVAFIFFILSQGMIQKVISSLSGKFINAAGTGLSTIGLLVTSLLAGVVYWGLSRMANK